MPRVDPRFRGIILLRLPSGQRGLILGIVHITLAYSALSRFQMEWHRTEWPNRNKGDGLERGSQITWWNQLGQEVKCAFGPWRMRSSMGWGLSEGSLRWVKYRKVFKWGLRPPSINRREGKKSGSSPVIESNMEKAGWGCRWYSSRITKWIRD